MSPKLDIVLTLRTGHITYYFKEIPLGWRQAKRIESRFVIVSSAVRLQARFAKVGYNVNIGRGQKS